MSDRQRLNELAISDTGFVFDPLSGATFNVNAAGLTLLDGLKAGLGRAGLIERLEARFEIGSADLDRDLDEFVTLLREHGLVGRAFRLEPDDA